MSSIIKGFIFDLDGVIVDTAKYHYLAWKSLADDLSIPFSKEQNEQLKGVSRIRSLEKILQWGNLTLSEAEFNTIIGNKNEHYLSYISNMTQDEILPDVLKVLDYVILKNQKIALGSASKNALAILDKVRLMDYFPTVIDGTKVTKAKPDPEVFIKAAQELDVAFENCIVFEDAIAGIQAANTAGMVSVGIGHKDILFEADYVFKDFTEISLDFINELIKN